MSYEEARSYLDSLGVDAMKAMAPSLVRIEAMCEALNHPERSIPALHITGTNGKTSTARIAAALLSAAGLSVGTYTSPHLETLRERITLAGDPISEADFSDAFEHLRPYLTHVERDLGERLTYFEVLTALFFLWAAEAPVDAMVVEVGLGGRWDATNVVDGRVSVITNVGFDHTGLLGTDRASIAGEKAGIIKPGGVVVTGERTPEAASVIADEAGGAGAGLLTLDRDFRLVENDIAVGGRYLAVETSSSGTYEDLFLPLHGRHQADNAALALEAVTRFLPARRLEQEIVAQGLAETVVPARLETIHREEGEPPIVLDVAHNPDGMSALVSSLIETFAFDKVRFVIGILGDKDYAGMLREITRVDCAILFCEASSVRSVPADELGKAAEALGLTSRSIEQVPAAVRGALDAAAPGEIVCITGSHYVVGEARTYLRQLVSL
jgi:dihydrofolate synthase/folylpolyglutamate synthase